MKNSVKKIPISSDEDPSGGERVDSSVVLEMLRPPAIVAESVPSVGESPTLPYPVSVFVCSDSGGGQLDAVNHPCVLEDEEKPSSHSP